MSSRGGRGIRLSKFLAGAGVASRRKCEALIAEGHIRVNGELVTAQGVRIDPAHDSVTWDGREIKAASRIYYVLYKPRGVLSSASDDRGRRTVCSFVPQKDRVYPVGRLDLGSEGLILLTNDGDLTQRLLHPRYEHERVYYALVRGSPDDRALSRLAKGLLLEGESRPLYAQARLMPGTWTWRREPLPRGTRWLEIVLREGHKRQIRRMLDVVGFPVRRLVRVRMGPVELGNLAPGQYRRLTAAEVEALKRETRRT